MVPRSLEVAADLKLPTDSTKSVFELKADAIVTSSIVAEEPTDGELRPAFMTRLSLEPPDKYSVFLSCVSVLFFSACLPFDCRARLVNTLSQISVDWKK